MHKLTLNNLCQQRRWTPAYTDRREGPDHESRFHATVAVGGAEFSSPAPGSRTRIQAQDLAARAALEHLSGPPQLLPEIHLPYKSLLRNYAQQLQKDLPLYNTTQSSPHHEPVFKSAVTIDGRTFGSLQECATKKEAESAAAVAALEAIRPEAKPSEQMLMIQAMSDTNPRHVLPEKEGSPKLMVHTQEECFEGGTSKKQKLMHVDELYLQHSKNKTATPGACAKCGCSKPTDQIKVYRRHPEIVLPDGATILSFSDDEWVAVRLPSPQP